MKQNNLNITITDEKPDDVYAVRNVQRLTWLDTYPNMEAGIDIADIESVFALDNTEEGMKRMELRKERFSDPTKHEWVARDNNKIVGFCNAMKEVNNGRIKALYVLPEYQGNLIGKKLIETGLNWLGSNQNIYVNVASYNTKAIGFYESCDFVKTGRDATDAVGKLPTGKIIPEIEMVKRSTHPL